MNTSDFLKALSKKSGFTYGDCDALIESMIAVFQDCVENKEDLYIYGFGKMKFVSAKQFTIRNDKTEKEIVIGGDERPRIYFRLSDNLKNKRKLIDKKKFIRKFVQKDFFNKLKEED